MPIKKLVLAALITTVVILYIAGGGEQYLSIGLYQNLFDRSPVITAAVFFTLFIIGTASSLPVAGIMIVVSGIIFGYLSGFLISLFASTLGGTLALLSVRVFFHDFIQRRFSAQIDVVNRGIEKEGALYLFSLRMIPVIPFWLLNLLVGLTSMRVPVFLLATLFGMVPITLILAYVGSQLSGIESFSMAAIFTPGLMLSLSLLAVFPFLARGIVKLTRQLGVWRT